MSLDSGIKGFVTATATVKVKFPIDWNDRDYIRCAKCPYLYNNDRTCMLNKKPVQFPDRYVGADCPLILEEKEE